MGKLIGIALGAGVTSALLFIVTSTGTSAALVLAYLAPLPLMIAGLGFTHVAGGLAALVGGGTVGIALGPVPGVIFLVILGLPAWYLARIAMLGRPVSAGTTGGVPAIEWFPVAQLILRISALAAGPVLLACLVVVWRFGGYQPALTALSARLSALFGRDTLPGDFRVVDLVKIAPVAMAASSVVMLSFNLWLAGRVVRISERLSRPWPDLPDSIRMPRGAVVGFAALLGGTLLPGPFGLAAAVLAAALGMAFVFEGLAAAHVLTRGFSARRATLAAIYLTVVFLMPWPLFALVLLGCIDCLASLRGGPAQTITKTPRS